MEMFGLNALETNKMDVCGFGGQQPADIPSYMYLRTQPNGKGLDATSSANLIQIITFLRCMILLELQIF